MGAFLVLLGVSIGLMVVVFVAGEIAAAVADPATTAAFETAAAETVASPPSAWSIITVGAATAVAIRTIFAVHRAYATSPHPITTVGTIPRVERDSATTPGVACRECRRDLRPGDRAERRRYWRETVVAGTVVARSDENTVHYCEAHAAPEVREQLEPIETPGETHAATETNQVPNPAYATDGGTDMAATPSDAFDTFDSVMTVFFLIPIVLTIAVVASMLDAEIPVEAGN